MKISPAWRVVLFAVGLFTTLYPVGAQEALQSSEVPTRARATEAATREAAVAAAAYQALGLDRPIRYQEVLADPDNIDLNVRFAKTQMAQGDALGASATLERILLINPELPPVRLFYVLVLLRQDRLEEAQRELTRLRQGPLPEEIRAEVEQYWRQVQQQRQRTKFTASLTNGYQFDTNRNASASSKEQFFSSSRIALSGTSRRRRDTSWLQLYSLDVAHDLGTQGGDMLVGGLDYYQAEQTLVDDLDLQSFAGEAGMALHTPWVTFTPLAVASHVQLSRETYFRSQGVKVKFDRALTSRLQLANETSWVREDVSGITESSAAAERRGDQTHTDFELSAWVHPKLQLIGHIGYNRKHAKASYYSYRGLELGGSQLWLLPRAMYLLTSVDYANDFYDEPDTALIARNRHDKELVASATYGVPLATLLPERWQPSGWCDQLSLAFTVEQTRTDSNLINYTYANTKVNSMLTKRVEF
jgi:hypothetical protein